MGEAKRRKATGIKSRKDRFRELMAKISRYSDREIQRFANRRFK